MEHGINMILVFKQSLINIEYKYENILKMTYTDISLIYSRWVTFTHMLHLLVWNHHYFGPDCRCQWGFLDRSVDSYH